MGWIKFFAHIGCQKIWILAGPHGVEFDDSDFQIQNLLKIWTQKNI